MQAKPPNSVAGIDGQARRSQDASAILIIVLPFSGTPQQGKRKQISDAGCWMLVKAFN
jgi:hypothetical protein